MKNSSSQAACQQPRISVLGSLNVDYVASVPRLPVRGETIAAVEFKRWFGGKGANQAVAAARQGAAVTIMGCLGADADGQAYRRRLAREGISTRALLTTSRASTGTALIAVDTCGENIIVVAAGANGKLSPAYVRSQQRHLASAHALLGQFEVPLAAVIQAMRIANRARVPVVINPSPLRDGFPWGDCAIDTVIVNEGEARAIFGLSLQNEAGWQRRLRLWHIERAIVTRGAQPTLCFSLTGKNQIPTLRVRPVDTVGAGDTFAGTYVALRAEGTELLAAIRYANCAAALATLKPGAQESIPTRAATEKIAAPG